MHRSVSISVPPPATDDLLRDLAALDGVISLSVQRGESVKPPGDVISATVLNTELDTVLRRAHDCEELGSVSVETSSVDTLLDSEQVEAIRRDLDEAAWEESETAMRRHTRLNLNFFLTCAAGGVIAATALISSSAVDSATALVGAAIIAPILEPLMRISLAAVNRHHSRLREGIGMALLSYVIVIAAAALTMLVLRAGGHYFVRDFLHNRTELEIQHPPVVTLIVSAAAAVAAAIIVAAGRFNALPGPLVAMQLLPAAATIGVAIEVGHWSAAARALGRLGIDVGMVLVAGLAVFLYKHFAVHQRRFPPH